MINFAHPWFALLLPLPLLVRYLWPARTRAMAADEPSIPVLLHPGTAHIKSAFSMASPLLPPGMLLQTALVSLLWATLTAALMQPQILREYTQITSHGYDLMLAVDTSRSMEALDFSVEGRRVNRLAVVKGVVGRFIEQRHGDRIGLVLFGDSAFVQAPLTLDGNAVRTMLDNAVPRMAGDSTAIGDAIGLATKKLRERPESSRVLILLTDGKNTAGSLPPLEAARLARHYNIRIHTIGVGSEGKVPIMEDGRLVMTDMPLDDEQLVNIARIGGGEYFRATDSHALETIYQRIDAMEKTEAETHSMLVPEPLYRWPLAVALLLLLTLAWLWTTRGLRGVA